MHKVFLMDQAGVLSIFQNTDVSEAELDEALEGEVHGGLAV